MKKVLDVSIGHVNFTIDEDAYYRLRGYLKRFEASIPDKNEAHEVMEDVEARVAEIFLNEAKFPRQVIDIKLVEKVIAHLGEIESEQSNSEMNELYEENYTKGAKRLFRDPDRKNVAGVCSGLSLYSGIDVAIIRVLFVLFTIFYGAALLLYIILWVVIPKAKTVAQKLQMRGIAPTAENIRIYNYTHKSQNY